jgi:hypothetical protein
MLQGAAHTSTRLCRIIICLFRVPLAKEPKTNTGTLQLAKDQKQNFVICVI